jgi:hypothetical protein
VSGFRDFLLRGASPCCIIRLNISQISLYHILPCVGWCLGRHTHSQRGYSRQGHSFKPSRLAEFEKREVTGLLRVSFNSRPRATFIMHQHFQGFPIIRLLSKYSCRFNSMLSTYLCSFGYRYMNERSAVIEVTQDTEKFIQLPGRHSTRNSRNGIITQMN